MEIDDARATVLKRLFLPGAGYRSVDERALALNLSFVLHERSDSAAVRSAIRAVRDHARIVNRLGTTCAKPMTTSELDTSAVTHWLTATIGMPDLLADALGASSERVTMVDADSRSCQTIEFFRASAQLTLPPLDRHTVGVAALVLRPGQRTGHLAVTDVHDWATDADGVIRSLERLVQAHAGQWMPRRALWSAPAETLLPDEVY